MSDQIPTLIDFVQINPDRKLTELSKKDKYSLMDSVLNTEDQTKRGLKIYFPLSHSARRINGRFYMPSGQRDGISSLLDPYPKPILVNHDLDGDALGRFTGGTYTDLRDEALPFLKNINDLFTIEDAFESNDPERIAKAVNKYGLVFNRKWPGLGQMDVSALITDEKAVERFLDGRYVTFSGRSVTDRFVCSACFADWYKEGPCEHRPGEMVDGHPMFIITGSFRVIEGSVVNRPADDFSILKSMSFADSDDNILLSLKDTELLEQDPTSLYLVDSTYSLFDTKEMAMNKNTSSNETEETVTGEQETDEMEAASTEETSEVSEETNTDSAEEPKAVETIAETEAPFAPVINIDLGSLADSLEESVTNKIMTALQPVLDAFGKQEPESKDEEEANTDAEDLLDSSKELENALSLVDNLKQELEMVIDSYARLVKKDFDQVDSEESLDIKLNWFKENKDLAEKTIDPTTIAEVEDPNTVSSQTDSASGLGSFERNIVDKYNSVKSEKGELEAERYWNRFSSYFSKGFHPSKL